MWRSLLDNKGMQYRPRARWTILVLLVLIILSPFSSGDKGLWLSIAPAPFTIFEALGGHFTAEESTLLRARSDVAPCSVDLAHEDVARSVALDDATTGIVRHERLGRTSPLSARPAPRDVASASSPPRGPPA